MRVGVGVAGGVMEAVGHPSRVLGFASWAWKGTALGFFFSLLVSAQSCWQHMVPCTGHRGLPCLGSPEHTIVGS